jgi:hypothetical protein
VTFPPSRAILEPESWWIARRLQLVGTTLYYESGGAAPLRDESGRWRRDQRGRIAIEALAALPPETMYGRLVDLERRANETGDPIKPADGLAAFRELIDFVKTFGPVGLEAGRSFEVAVPQAEAWRRELEQTQWQRLGLEPPVETRRAILDTTVSRWQVVFPDPALVGPPQVHLNDTNPDLPWEERLGRGDGALLRDELGPVNGGLLSLVLDTLAKAIELTRALGEASVPDVRRCLENDYPLVLDPDRPVRDGDRIALDLRRALKPWRRYASPFRAPDRFDWLILGRLVLAATIDRQLWWTSVRVGLEDKASFRRSVRIGSLVEVAYLQLLEHIELRLHLGVGRCGYCGGPILNLRQGQQWHEPNCASAGRKRRSRAKAAAAVSTETD